MNTHPKNIQIFLPSGDQHGMRIASITTRVAQLIEAPRSGPVMVLESGI